MQLKAPCTHIRSGTAALMRKWFSRSKRLQVHITPLPTSTEVMDWWTPQLWSQTLVTCAFQWNAEIHDPDIFVSCRNYSTCISFTGRPAVPGASVHPELQTTHHASRLERLAALGSPATAQLLRRSNATAPAMGADAHSGSTRPLFIQFPPTHTSYQQVHQPMAHINHTNSETVVKSAQSSSTGTHKIALQTAKVNLE